MKNKFLEMMNDVKENIVTKTNAIEITPDDVICQSVKIPGVKINREQFLRKELTGKFSDEIVNLSIEKNPFIAGITKDEISSLAKKVINYETNKVSIISFAAGIPGGTAIAATIPADILQYFGFIIRIMQELAYLYGFPELDLSEENLNSETMNEILIFLGVMFGVQEANAGVKIISTSITQTVVKRLSQKALTKTTTYPIIKKIATLIGIKMTKQVFSNGVAKIVPIAGGFITGGITYSSFKTCANRLKECFSNLIIN